MNEETLTAGFAKLFRLTPGVIAGPGDDCAVLEIPGFDKYMIAAVDQVVKGIHYLPEETPERIAGKLLRRNLSDIAAMGGTPAYVMLSLAWNPMDEEKILRFHQEMNDECNAYGIAVIGGDMSAQKSHGEVSSLSILGFAGKSHVKLRGGAHEGDLLLGTGCFGRSFETGHHIDFNPRMEEGLYLGGLPEVHAMMDVSDGLLKDALRSATASNLALNFDYDAIPLRDSANVEDALCDGEDYELIFALEPTALDGFLRSWPFGEKPAVIGKYENGTPGQWSNPIPLNKKGYDHFNDQIHN